MGRYSRRFEEHRGPINWQEKVRRWSGDANNVFCQLRQCCPNSSSLIWCFNGPEPLDPRAQPRRAFIRPSGNPHKAVEGADLIVTDHGLVMHDPRARANAATKPVARYQVKRALWARPKDDAVVHALPARARATTRQQSEGHGRPPFGVFDGGPRNRLHAAKGGDAMVFWRFKQAHNKTVIFSKGFRYILVGLCPEGLELPMLRLLTFLTAPDFGHRRFCR